MGVLIAVCSSRAHEFLYLLPPDVAVPAGPRVVPVTCQLPSSDCLSPRRRAPRGRRAAARGPADPPGAVRAGRPASSPPERGSRAADAHRRRVPEVAVADRAGRRRRPTPPSPRRHGATGPAHPVPGIRRTCASERRGLSGFPAGQSHSMLPPNRPGSRPRQDRRSAQCTGQRAGGNPYSAAGSDAASDYFSSATYGAVDVDPPRYFSSATSERMSIRQPVSRAARRAFCPSLPMARDSW